jgi:hypothetical protein
LAAVTRQTANQRSAAAFSLFLPSSAIRRELTFDTQKSQKNSSEKIDNDGTSCATGGVREIVDSPS